MDIVNRLGIEEKELPSITMLLMHSFFNGAALVLFDTATNSLFLSKLDETKLPYAFICSALAMAVVGFLYSRLQEKISPKLLFLGTTTFVCASIFLSYFLLSISNSVTVVFALMVFKSVAYSLLAIEFWAVAGLIFTLRQGKRLFGLVGSGEIIAEIFVGFLIPFIISKTGRPHELILCAGIFTAISLFNLLKIFKHHPEIFSPHLGFEQEQTNEDAQRSFKDLFKENYLKVFFIMSSLSFFVEYFLEFVFYQSIHSKFTDEVAIASFFGTYTGILACVQIVMNSFLSGPIIFKHGLRVGLLALPIGDALGVAVVLVCSMLGFVNPLFYVIAAIKMMDVALRTGLEGPASRILYQAIPDSDRMRVRTIRETMIEPGAAGIAGGLLLLLSVLILKTNLGVFFVILAATGAIVYLALILCKNYPELLLKALNLRKRQDFSIDYADPSTLQIIKDGVQSKSTDEVIYSLKLLEKMNHPYLFYAIESLIDSTENKICTYVFRKLDFFRTATAREKLKNRLLSEKNPNIKSLLLQAVCATSPDEEFDTVCKYLQDAEREVRTGAVVALLRSGNIEGVLAVGEKLITLLNSADPEQRLMAAEILGEAGVANFYRPVVQLLRDSEPKVIKAAIRATGKLKNPKLIPLLLNQISIPHLRGIVVQALTEFGEQIISHVESEFSNEAIKIRKKIYLVRVLEKIQNVQSAKVLFKYIAHPDGNIQTRILQGLVTCNFTTKKSDRIAVDQVIQDQAQYITWLLVTRQDLNALPKVNLLRQALHNELARAQERILLALALCYPSHAISKAKSELKSNDPNTRSKAIELIENILRSKHKAMVRPIVEDLYGPGCIQKLQDIFPQQQMNLNQRLLEIISPSQRILNSWTKTCAIYEMGLSPSHDFKSSLEYYLGNPERTLKETATWALSKIKNGDTSIRKAS